MVSGHTAYNALLASNAELLEELYGRFCFDRSHETQPGEDPFTYASICSDAPDGVRRRRSRNSWNQTSPLGWAMRKRPSARPG